MLLHCSGIIYSGQFFLHSLPGLLCHPSSVFRHFLVLVKPFRISLFGKLSGESLGKGINGSLKVGHVVTEVFLVESFEILIFPRGKAGSLPLPGQWRAPDPASRQAVRLRLAPSTA